MVGFVWNFTNNRICKEGHHFLKLLERVEEVFPCPAHIALNMHATKYVHNVMNLLVILREYEISLSWDLSVDHPGPPPQSDIPAVSGISNYTNALVSMRVWMRKI